jgi:uncharacterized damage-inducible protein DinB
MFRTISDFLTAWKGERDSTVKVFRELTDPSLERRVTPKGRSLGFIAWHLTTSLAEVMNQAGLEIAGPMEKDPMPTRATVLTALYENAADAMAEAVRTHWTDEQLPEEISVFGEKMLRGAFLMSIIAHQTHHRGQMTVLMRQSGLRVPGVYGPSLEEWALFGTPAQP